MRPRTRAGRIILKNLKKLWAPTSAQPPAAPAPQRSQYKQVWNSVSRDVETAKLAVSGYVDEDQYRAMGKVSRDMLKAMAGYGPDDTILEIGAGVGRVGAFLAPECREWIGCDASGNMVEHMKHRLAHLPNARAVEISGYDLQPIADESVDLVYSTVVYMHLDEWDRWAYIREGMRVLRPGGRMLVDNVNLGSDEGWAFFLDHCKIEPGSRPPNISKTSTSEELRIYFERAGFKDIAQHKNHLWITTVGTKSRESAI